MRQGKIGGEEEEGRGEGGGGGGGEEEGGEILTVFQVLDHSNRRLMH